MCDKYITPETDMLDMAAAQVLCQSGTVQSGTVETVDRMEFDW